MFIIYREWEITKIFNDMIEDFKPQRRYEVGTLKDFILLVPETVHLDYTIDDGRCSVKKFVTNEGVIKIEGGSVTMSSTETTDSRLKFNNSVQITINEGQYDRFTDIIRQVELNKYRVVVEDLMGNQFVMNVEFPAFVTHSVTFTDGSIPNTFRLSMSTESNFPTLFLESKVSAVTTFNMRLCKYVTGRIVDFRMCEHKYSRVIESGGKLDGVISYGKDNFKKIEFIPNSFTFSESFDGDKYQQQIQFTIPLSEYKHYWQYNLVEFANNRYTILFLTDNNLLVCSGGDLGFIPSYVIETSEEVSSRNVITITLVHVAERAASDTVLDDTAGRPSIDDFIDDDDNVVYTPVPPFQHGTTYYPTSECIDDHTAMYTLLEETTPVGERLGRFWVLRGLSALFDGAGLNIVGEFEPDSNGYWNGVLIIYPDQNCSGEYGCRFILKPSQYLFTFNTKNTRRTFTVQSNCKWEITNVPDWLSVYPVKSENVSSVEIVAMELKYIPTETKNDTMTISNGTESYSLIVRFFMEGESTGDTCGWIESYNNNVDANGGSVTFSFNSIVDPSKQMTSVLVDNPHNNVTINVINNELVITIPPNTYGMNVAYVFYLTYGDGYEPCEILVFQTNKFYTRVSAEGFICDGTDKYAKVAVYWGDTEYDTPNFQGYERGALIEHDSKDCKNFIEKWVDIEGYICIGTAKYTAQKLQRSYDDGLTWEDTYETRPNNLVDTDSSDCDGNYDYEWRIDEDDYICEGHTSYKVEKQFVSYDGGVSWHLTGETRTAEPIRTDDPRCGGAAKGEYRWVDSEGYICEDRQKWSVQKELYSEDGVSWIETGATRKGVLLSEDSDDCDGNYDYEWRVSQFAFVCDEEMTSYHIEYYCISYDGGISWHLTGEQRRDGIIMYNDPKCEDDGTIYRWFPDGGVICEVEEEPGVSWMEVPDEYICMEEGEGTNWVKIDEFYICEEVEE